MSATQDFGPSAVKARAMTNDYSGGQEPDSGELKGQTKMLVDSRLEAMGRLIFTPVTWHTPGSLR